MRIDNLYDEKDAPSSFEPIPPGEYRVRIKSSERVDNKKGSGWHIKWVYEVFEGEYKGRTLYDRMNLVNDNEVAVKIARETFAAMRTCFGCANPKDSAEMHGMDGVVRVRCRERTDTKAIVNEIASYIPKGGADDRPRPQPKTSGGVPW